MDGGKTEQRLQVHAGGMGHKRMKEARRREWGGGTEEEVERRKDRMWNGTRITKEKTNGRIKIEEGAPMSEAVGACTCMAGTNAERIAVERTWDSGWNRKKRKEGYKIDRQIRVQTRGVCGRGGTVCDLRGAELSREGEAKGSHSVESESVPEHSNANGRRLEIRPCGRHGAVPERWGWRDDEVEGEGNVAPYGTWNREGCGQSCDTIWRSTNATWKMGEGGGGPRAVDDVGDMLKGDTRNVDDARKTQFGGGIRQRTGKGTRQCGESSSRATCIEVRWEGFYQEVNTCDEQEEGKRGGGRGIAQNGVSARRSMEWRGVEKEGATEVAEEGNTSCGGRRERDCVEEGEEKRGRGIGVAQRSECAEKRKKQATPSCGGGGGLRGLRGLRSSGGDDVHSSRWRQGQTFRPISDQPRGLFKQPRTKHAIEPPTMPETLSIAVCISEGVTLSDFITPVEILANLNHGDNPPLAWPATRSRTAKNPFTSHYGRHVIYSQHVYSTRRRVDASLGN
ncbi:hypothetical protein C8R44DRAFT_947393 [Mycena epipterygia]|nr:hypothetical protein C8R44DRAFT_947393 [Mycena epipterygia]